MRYASCFIAMPMGRRLHRDLGTDLGSLDHRVFPQAQTLIQVRGEAYFGEEMKDIEKALRDLYAQQSISAQ